MGTIVLIAIVVMFFVAPRLLGSIVGAILGTASGVAKHSVRNTLQATSSVREGFHEPSELKGKVGGLAEKMKAWAEEEPKAS